jgi:LacI family transcriptional regulator
MAATIKQIAALAGVSRGTVDRVLNNRGNVNKDVEHRVNEIASRLGYKPNLVAKSLANRCKNHKIGVLVSAKGNDFFSEVFTGIEAATEEIHDFGFSVQIKNMLGFDVQNQLDGIDELIKQGITALAITPINDKRIKEKLSQINDMGVPIVALNSDIEGCDFVTYVGCDYYASGRTAGGMMGLVTYGKANVLVVTGSYKILGHNRRISGFSDVIEGEYPDITIVDTVEGNDSNSLTFKLVDEFLKKDKNITAVYFAAGGAVGGVKAIIENGMQSKIKIITNDATMDRIKHIKAGIIDATICQQPYEQGYQSVKLLFDHLMGASKIDGAKRYTNIGIKLKYNFNQTI